MLFKMSLSGGILILFIIAVRFAALNKLPKRMFMMLWLVALLRLLLPVEFPLAYGIASPVTEAVEKSRAADLKSAGFESAGQKQALTISRGSFNLPVIVWLSGMMVMFFFLGILYFREYRKMQEALPVSGERERDLRAIAGIPGRVKIMVSDRIVSPMTFGLRRPKIILPKVWQPENDSQLKYVLIHEVVHIKRADNLWKIMMLSALCIHWFNPLVFLMYVLFNRDMELSCDEKVLLLTGAEAKNEYAVTLVNLAESQQRLSAFSAGFGKNAVKERIVAIMKFKKITTFGIVCAMALTCVSVTAFAEGKSGMTEEHSGIQNIVSENVSTSFNQIIASSDIFPEYEKYGLSYDADTDHFMYEGRIVGFFHDETSPGVYTHLTDENGEVFLTVSRDSSNKITGFKQMAGISAGDTSEGDE